MSAEDCDGPRLRRVRDVAKQLSLSRSMIYQLMDAGRLSYVKIGKSRRVLTEAVEKLVLECSVNAEVRGNARPIGKPTKESSLRDHPDEGSRLRTAVVKEGLEASLLDPAIWPPADR